MTTFAFHKIEEIQCTKIVFRKLSRNGKCFLNQFEDEIKDNSQYYSEFKTLLSYLEYYSTGAKLPVVKYKELSVKKHKLFEFRSKNLRLYGIPASNGRVIIMCGYKKNQDKDLNRLEALLKELINFL